MCYKLRPPTQFTCHCTESRDNYRRPFVTRTAFKLVNLNSLGAHTVVLSKMQQLFQWSEHNGWGWKWKEWIYTHRLCLLATTKTKYRIQCSIQITSSWITGKDSKRKSGKTRSAVKFVFPSSYKPSLYTVETRSVLKWEVKDMKLILPHLRLFFGNSALIITLEIKRCSRRENANKFC